MCPSSFLNELDDVAYYTPEETEASTSETQELELEQMALAMEGVDDTIFNDITVITNNQLVKKSLESLKKFKEKIKDTSVARKFDVEKENVLSKINKQKEKIKKVMSTAPFWRSADKLGFVFGTILIISFSFIIGRYPDTLAYTFIQWLLPSFLFYRYVHYYSMGWHYYISDFCYYENLLILYFLWFDSSNEQLFLICYLFAQGVVAFSIKAFRNSLVYHKPEKLCDLFIHSIPMTIKYHIRWFTIPSQ